MYEYIWVCLSVCGLGITLLIGLSANQHFGSYTSNMISTTIGGIDANYKPNENHNDTI